MSKMLKRWIFDEAFPPEFSDDCGSIRDDDPDTDPEVDEREEDDLIFYPRMAG